MVVVEVVGGLGRREGRGGGGCCRGFGGSCGGFGEALEVVVVVVVLLGFWGVILCS